MKIVQIDVYKKTYTLVEQIYAWSGGHQVTSLDSHIVKLTTGEGLAGYGEGCPLGPAYMPAYARGIPTGIKELGPVILGKDPLQIGKLNTLMDSIFYGHSYVKSPIDIACWDLLGKASNQSVATLLGGRYVEDFPLYRAVSQGRPEEMAEKVRGYQERGYAKFQLKVGDDPDEDIARIKAVAKVARPGDVVDCDANTGWNLHQAARVVNGLADLDVYIEQPCPTLGECLSIRQRTRLPFVLDEVITGVGPFLEAYQNRAMDVINLKISRVGGLTKAKQIRDLAQGLGIAMIIEDSAGGDITTAAINHLVGSTQPQAFFSSTDFNSWFHESISPDAPRAEGGRIAVSSGPGLGIAIDEKELGKPLFTLK